MKNDERLLLCYIILTTLLILLMSYRICYDIQIIKTYQKADYELGLKLDKVQNQLEIIKILVETDKNKNSKQELIKALEDLFNK